MPSYKQSYGKVFDIEVRGLAEAERNLKRLDLKIRRSVTKKAGTAGGRILVKHARREAPHDTGNLKKTIRQRSRLLRSGKGQITVVKPRATKGQKKKGIDSFYAHMLIGGTKPHDLGSRGKRPKPPYSDHPYSRINHPGAAPDDFMWRAARRGATEAITAFRNRYVPLVNEETAKLPK